MASGSKFARITPADGEAFLISAMTASTLFAQGRAKRTNGRRVRDLRQQALFRRAAFGGLDFNRFLR